MGRSFVERPSYNRFLGHLRRVAILIAVVGIVWWAEPTPLSVSVGFFFVALGEVLRFWAAGHLHKTVELITSGPYRYTRNPLYLGRLLILTGLCLMARLPYHAHWAVLAAGHGIFFCYYLPRKERVEPARLREVHGEPYEDYYRAVPALFPSLRPYAAAPAVGWSSDHMLRNREHWMILGLVAVTLLLLRRAYVG